MIQGTRVLAVTLILLLGFCVGIIHGQETELQRVVDAYYLYDRDKAIEIANEVLQTTTDDKVIIAAKYLKAKSYTSLQQFALAEAVLDSLIQDYPEDEERFFWISDKFSLGVPTFPDSEESRQRILQSYQEMLAAVGAAPAEQFVSDPISFLSRLDAEGAERRFLIDIYTAYAYAMDDIELNKAVLESLRENDSSFVWSSFYGSLVRLNEAYQVELLPPTETDQRAPSLTDRSTSISTRNPVVWFLLMDGGLGESQIDLETLSIAINSLPRDNYEIDTQLNFTAGSPFLEILTIYVPVGDLEPGTYQISVTVKDGAKNQVEKTWAFTFKDDPKEDLILNSSKDTILSFRSQHLNEGSNPLLTLDKNQGKATRDAVAFDLANTNLSGLSRATLLLTIDSNQAVNGWGNGRSISAQTITMPWQEGNGRNFGLKKKDQIAGDGAGATWFSPIDENISNDSSNSAVNWNGAATSVSPPTSPAVQVVNFQSGEVAFDVTADVLNGAENGWLILKDQENVGSKVSFYSREGAAAAGNPDLAPRLILEFGSPVASAAPSESLLAKFGFGSIGTKLRPSRGSSELRSVREIIQDSPVAALAAEQMLFEATRTNPVLNMTARTAYRSWLAEDLRVAAAPVWVG